MLDYTIIRREAATALVEDGHADAIAGALIDREGCEKVELGGRAKLERFDCGAGTGLIRRSHRGGVFAGLLKDTYLFVNRPRREFEVHRIAIEREVAVPALLGVMWERKGIGYRGAIATRQIEGEHLQAYLAEPPSDAEEMLRKVGRAIAEMHEAGIFHADLQLKNILVGEGGPVILDFDGARVSTRVSTLARKRNLLRLRRSFSKNGVSLKYFVRVCEGYGAIARMPWLEWVYQVKHWVSDRVAGRTIDSGRPDSPEGVRALREGFRRVYLAADVDGAEVTRALEQAGEELQDTRKRSVRRVGGWVVKRSLPLAGRTMLKQTLRRGRYRRAWLASFRLGAEGVHVPAPRAYIETGGFGIVTGNILVTDFLEGHRDVVAYARELQDGGASEAEKAAYLAGVAEAVNGFNASGLYHQDLKTDNILTGDGKTFSFIDLDDVVMDEVYDTAARLKNHVQLYYGFKQVWDDELLHPFIERMLPEGADRESWFRDLRLGYEAWAERKERVRARRARQGKSTPSP